MAIGSTGPLETAIQLIRPRIAQLLKRQKGCCNACNLVFRDADVIELDHIILRSLGGLDVSSNWQLLHRHYHLGA
ncbi:MAG: HNH endonuclease [Cyanobacteria bacterium Co-bin8]|nr:HNH endonuclease [Cyanobacteria bacterium Co-bin8]